MLCTLWESKEPLHLFLHSHTGWSATAAVFPLSVDCAPLLSQTNIFLNTSTVMLTSAIACQHDILLGDKGGISFRMTVFQACRQENSGADRWAKKNSVALSLPPSAFDWSCNGACAKLHLNILERASMPFDVQTFYGNQVEDTSPGRYASLYSSHQIFFFCSNELKWTLHTPLEILPELQSGESISFASYIQYIWLCELQHVCMLSEG